jgi:hypothetical protein
MESVLGGHPCLRQLWPQAGFFDWQHFCWNFSLTLGFLALIGLALFPFDRPDFTTLSRV